MHVPMPATLCQWHLVAHVPAHTHGLITSCLTRSVYHPPLMCHVGPAIIAVHATSGYVMIVL